jgi:hypothetical protein
MEAGKSWVCGCVGKGVKSYKVIYYKNYQFIIICHFYFFFNLYRSFKSP